MAFLTFHFDKNFIYVLIYWVLEIAFRIVSHEKKVFFKMTKEEKYNEYIMIIILSNIADLLSIFLVLYMRCASKGTRKKKKIEGEIKNENPIDSKIELIHDNYNIVNRGFPKKLIVIAILDYISRSTYWISYAITGAESKEISHTLQKNITISIDIIMRYIFSVFILKIVVYKHRIFSLITIVIGFVILIINDICLMKYKNDSHYDFPKSFYYTAIISISGFVYPLEDTFVKQVFSEDYLYPANMQFDRGLLVFVLILVITPILYFSFNLDLTFIKEDIYIIIITMIMYTLAAFVKAYILLKIIYNYSSQSVSFLIISESFAGFIIRAIQRFNGETEVWEYFSLAMEFLGVIIILLSSLIYDEIIIINKWGLNNNVKTNITARSESEMKNMFKISDTLTTNLILQTDSEEKNNEKNDNIE